jgi:hypothetical protein
MNTPRTLKCPMTDAPCAYPECARPKCVAQQRAEFVAQQLEERRAVGYAFNEFLKRGTSLNSK